MRIEITGSTKENKGKYQVVNFEYNDLGKGASGKKRLVSFGDEQGTFKLLENAEKGSIWEIKAVKGEDGYWKWKEAVKQSGLSSSSEAKASPKSSYETPEERAQKQIYIVRQSSIAAAISLLKTEKNIPDVKSVLDVAKQFEQYVFGEQVGSFSSDDMAKAGVYDMKDDLPFEVAE